MKYVSFLILSVFIIGCKNENKSNLEIAGRIIDTVTTDSVFYHTVIEENIFPGTGTLKIVGEHQIDNSEILKRGVYTHPKDSSQEYNVYYFSVDSLKSGEYTDLIRFNFIVPKDFNFRNFNRETEADTIIVISDYYKIKTDTVYSKNNFLLPEGKMNFLEAGGERKVSHGRLCSARMASYENGLKYYDDGKKNKYIPVEGIYGHKDNICVPTADGLRNNEIYGFFIKIENNQPDTDWKYETDLYSNFCPFNLRRENGYDKFYIYKQDQVTIHREVNKDNKHH